MTELNGNLGARVSAHTRDLEWQPSPSATVFRKRLHLVGEPEKGQVTSLVRFVPGSSFSAHDHPEGEEILVIAGVFSDERSLESSLRSRVRRSRSRIEIQPTGL